jgi:hypothetical protein
VLGECERLGVRREDAVSVELERTAAQDGKGVAAALHRREDALALELDADPDVAVRLRPADHAAHLTPTTGTTSACVPL